MTFKKIEKHKIGTFLATHNKQVHVIKTGKLGFYQTYLGQKGNEDAKVRTESSYLGPACVVTEVPNINRVTIHFTRQTTTVFSE